MMWSIPEEATRYGFTLDGLGSHSSRTMMLSELKMLLASRGPDTDIEEYRSVIIDENSLLKKTDSTRRKSFRHLRELYALDRNAVLFSALRDLWDEDEESQPLLGVLCAVARDPSLRATTPVILHARESSVVTSEMMAEAVREHYPGRLKASTLAKIGRNTASSWTQSGHLEGRTHKVRTMAQSDPVAVTYALLLGHLCDVRGEALFHTLWARILDAPIHTLKEQAALASRQGWLDYRQSGAVTEVTFDYLLGSFDTQGPAT